MPSRAGPVSPSIKRAGLLRPPLEGSRYSSPPASGPTGPVVLHPHRPRVTHSPMGPFRSGRWGAPLGRGPATAAALSGSRSVSRIFWAGGGLFRSSAEYSTWSIGRQVRCSAQSSSLGHQDGHPPPALRSGGRDPLAGRKPNSAVLADPALPRPPPRHQRLQAPSDIGGSGGVPRQATAWETEARSVPGLFARSVNTEGPGP